MTDKTCSVSRKTVEGWLRGCIHDHGPITNENVASASKRIWGQMAGLDTDTYWKRRYRSLRYVYDRLNEQRRSA